MAPFVYQQPTSPYANTIAQLLLHQNDPQAQAAQTIAAANARAGEVAANAWGGAVQGITNAATNVVGSIERQQEIAPKLAADKIALANLQEQQRGKAALDTALAGNTLAPGAEGPRLPNFMDANNRYDIPALRDWLNGRGLGSQTPDLLAHAETMNESLDKSETAQAAAQNNRTIYLGNAVQTALKLHQQINMPLDGAVTFAAQQPLASKQLTQPQLDGVVQRLGALPPDQQIAYLQTFVDAADKLQKTTTVKADETIYTASGKKLYEGEPKKDETWLQNDAATFGKPNQTATAAQSMDAVRLKNPEWWLKNDAATVGQPNETSTAKQSLIAIGLGGHTAEQDAERFRQIGVNDQLGNNKNTPTDVAWAKSYVKEKLLSPEYTASEAYSRLWDTFTHSDSQLATRELFQQQQKGRAVITDKLNPEYTTRVAAADMIERTIKEAQGDPAHGIPPNMSAAQLQNLELTMGMIRAQGLNRINSAELTTNAGAGSLLTGIEGWIGKHAAGQPVPKDIQQGMLRMTQILREEAQSQYLEKFNNNKTLNFLGDDVKPIFRIPQFNRATGKVE